MWAESNNKNSKNNYQNNRNYNNGNNFKYNPNQNKGNGDNKDNIRCNFCNIKGHTIATCRHRQKEEYLNAGNGGANTSWCKYCKCAGHTIAVCKKRIYKESQGGSNSNNNYNSAGNSVIITMLGDVLGAMKPPILLNIAIIIILSKIFS